jgi:hypothetical protein
MQLAEFRAERQRSRRHLEWKLSLSLWLLLAAATYYLRKRPPEEFVITALVSVILVHGIAWVWHIWRANRRDSEAACYYFNCAEHILTGKAEHHEFRLSMRDWLSPVQLLITVLLAGAAYFLLGNGFS